jgi:hypothetical protein
MDIVSDLMQQAGSSNIVSRISSASGADPAAVTQALGMSAPVALGAMAQTAAKPGGAETLAAMASQAATIPAASAAGAAAAGGSSLASSLFGSQLGPVQNAIAERTGLPPAVVGQILAVAVPMVLNYLMQKTGGQGAGGIAGLVAGQAQSALTQSPDAAAIVEQMAVSQAGSSVSGMLKNFL